MLIVICAFIFYLLMCLKYILMREYCLVIQTEHLIKRLLFVGYQMKYKYVWTFYSFKNTTEFNEIIPKQEDVYIAQRKYKRPEF